MLVLAGTAAVVLPAPATAEVRGEVFRLEAEGEPLGRVLEAVGEAFGYAVGVNPGWEAHPVTARVEAETLGQALEALLRDRSYCLLVDDGERRVAVRLLATATTGPAASEWRRPGGDGPDGAGREVSHPTSGAQGLLLEGGGEPGQGGLSLREVRALQGTVQPLDPSLLEAVPPEPGEGPPPAPADLPGGDRAGAAHDPVELEAVPPGAPWSPAATLAAVNEARRALPPLDPARLEAVPAAEAGGPGVTPESLVRARGEGALPDPAELPVCPE